MRAGSYARAPRLGDHLFTLSAASFFQIFSYLVFVVFFFTLFFPREWLFPPLLPSSVEKQRALSSLLIDDPLTESTVG